MFLLLIIAGCGAWCAHQHWMRLGQEKGPWRDLFWNWMVRGLAFPALVWVLANFGWGDRFPALVPHLADLHAARQPWMGAWMGVSFAGAILVATYWLAVTYAWILGEMFRQTKSRAELAFNVGVFGLFSGALGLALGYFNGPMYLGAAGVIALLPIVHMTSDLAEAPVARPVYDRAIGQMKFGKYQAAEWEVIAQLEKREDDFEGWLMLADLYARQHRDIENAARVILDICQNPSTDETHISLACHKLADWQIEIAGNPEGARAALELLCRKCPGTHFATMARQRMGQLPRDAAELAEKKKPKRIQLPPLREDSNETESHKRLISESVTEANRLVERLTENPDDFKTREKLAGIMATELGKVDQAIEQLRLLVEIPDATDMDEQKAKWLAQIAAWELHAVNNPTRYKAVLTEIIQRFPQTAAAFAAQRKLFQIPV